MVSVEEMRGIMNVNGIHITDEAITDAIESAVIKLYEEGVSEEDRRYEKGIKILTQHYLMLSGHISTALGEREGTAYIRYQKIDQVGNGITHFWNIYMSLFGDRRVASFI